MPSVNTEYFQRKLLETTRLRSVMESSSNGEQAKATEAPLQVSLIIKKAKKNHRIAVNLIQPAAKEWLILS